MQGLLQCIGSLFPRRINIYWCALAVLQTPASCSNLPKLFPFLQPSTLSSTLFPVPISKYPTSSSRSFAITAKKKYYSLILYQSHSDITTLYILKYHKHSFCFTIQKLHISLLVILHLPVDILFNYILILNFHRIFLAVIFHSRYVVFSCFVGLSVLVCRVAGGSSFIPAKWTVKIPIGGQIQILTTKHTQHTHNPRV